MAITDREGTYTSDARYLHQGGMEWLAHTKGESSEYYPEVSLASTLCLMYSEFLVAGVSGIGSGRGDGTS